MRTSPPSRSEASRTVTCAWGRLRCSSRAQVRPETPGGTGRSSWKAKPWLQTGVLLKMVSTPKPNGWWSLSLLNGYNWEYTQHFQTNPNMFKMVQTCSIFVASFSQCLNLVESGHKAGNIGTTECPSENARPHSYHTSAHDAKLGSCHQLVATPKRSHSWVLWHSNSMMQPIASHGHHKCRFYADNQRTSKNCGFLSAIVALLWYILIHCRLLGKKETYRNRSGWCWKTD